MYTPPTTKGEGTLTYPDSAGGVQWGGVAFDPPKQNRHRQHLHIVQYVKLYSREDYDNADKDSGNESGFALRKAPRTVCVCWWRATGWACRAGSRRLAKSWRWTCIRAM
ncbi:hypothetical protein ACVXG7_27960 [Enterobacter hormaechei]